MQIVSVKHTCVDMYIQPPEGDADVVHNIQLVSITILFDVSLAKRYVTSAIKSPPECKIYSFMYYYVLL